MTTDERFIKISAKQEEIDRTAEESNLGRKLLIKY